MPVDAQNRTLKVAIIVYCIDPNNEIRILMRHNKSFDPHYRDEWTFAWGTVEEGEDIKTAALREMKEELGIAEYTEVKQLDGSYEYTGRHGLSTVAFFAVKINNIDVSVKLNEESIGYDWMKMLDARKILLDDGVRVFLDQLAK